LGSNDIDKPAPPAYSRRSCLDLALILAGAVQPGGEQDKPLSHMAGRYRRGLLTTGCRCSGRCAAGRGSSCLALLR
jgi:hypothetical protein